MDFPQPEPTDTDEVAWAIQTAHTSWKRGDVADAMRWLQRAADAAEAAGDDRRLLALARAATEFAQVQKSKPSASPQPAREMPRPPPPPRASAPPRHHTVIGLGAPQAEAPVATRTQKELPRTPPPLSRTPGPPPVSRTPSPPPPSTRGTSPPPSSARSSSPPVLSRDSDPDFDQVTRVYDSGQLRAATEDTRPTPIPPRQRVTASPALETPIPPKRTSIPAAETPIPPARTTATPARTPAVAAVTSRPPPVTSQPLGVTSRPPPVTSQPLTVTSRPPVTPHAPAVASHAPAVASRPPAAQTTSKQPSIAPQAIKPLGQSERPQQAKSGTHRAVRVSVARQDASTLIVRLLAEGERAPMGSREAMLVPLHADEDLF